MSTTVLEENVNGVADTNRVFPDFTEAEIDATDIGDTAGMDAKTARSMKEYEKSAQATTSAYVDAYDGADTFARHLRAGKRFDAHVQRSKGKVFKAWNGSQDYLAVAKKISEMVAIESTFRVRPEDDHIAYLFVEAFKAVTPKVFDLRWSHVVNVLAPASITYDRKNLEATIRAGWVDTIKDIVDNQTAPDGQPLTVAELREFVKARQAEILADSEVGITLEIRAKKEHAKAVRESNKKQTVGRNAVAAGLAAAVENGVTAETIGRTIAEAGIILPQAGPDPLRLDETGAEQFALLLVQAGNWKAIFALHKALGKHIAEMKAVAQQAA